MVQFPKKKSLEKLSLFLIVTVNFLYLITTFFSPSSFLLVLSFSLEAFYFLTYQGERKSFLTFYRDISPLLALGKAALFCLYRGGILIFIPFLVAEVYLLALYRAGFYFNYLASAIPCLNFKNFGQLKILYTFITLLKQFQNALYLRPLLHLFIVVVVILPATYLLYGMIIFLLATGVLFICFCVKSAKVAIYLKSKNYKNDLKAHAKYHSPEVVVYVSGASGSSYQLAQWIPVLKQLDKKVIVIARETFWITDIKDNPLHTVYARGLEDIEQFITSNTKICLYPANAYKNTQMMRRAELAHIFINHGESDKIVNVSRLVGAYTKLYLAGPMAKDRLTSAGISIGKNQFTYVGRPQTSIFLTTSPKKTGNILYAPTWEGFDAMSNYNSVAKLAFDIIQEIVNHTEYDILFKPHPLTGTVRSDLRNKLADIQSLLLKTGRGCYIREENILEVMNRSDVLITDISSVMNDFLATEKPYIVTNPSAIPTTSFENQFPTTRGGYILHNATEITAILDDIILKDPKKHEREQMKKYSLGDFQCSALDKFKNEISADYENGCCLSINPHTTEDAIDTIASHKK